MEREKKCANCGAKLSFDYTTNTNCCSYCGKVAPGLEPGGIPFRHTLADFRRAVIGFMSGGDLTPVDLISKADFIVVQQRYYPFYQTDRQLVYGGTDEIDGEELDAFVKQADKKQIVAFGTLDVNGVHVLESRLDAEGLFYYPAWYAVYTYRGYEYAIYMDDQSGEINGGRAIATELAPPTRTKIYQKYLFIGFGLWFGLLLLRATLGAFIGHPFDTHNMNNLLFSEPAEQFWFLRGLVFLGVFPLIIITAYYPKLKGAYFNRLCQQREQTARQTNIVFLKTNGRVSE